ncbi:hypothetical protein DW227_02165 [Clostridium sp. AM18-55]|nr:hypothetical protein DW227_02165 [Clostridium sp. AM18-55]
MRLIFRQPCPNFINVRTAYVSEIWTQLTKNHLTKSSTERFREYITRKPEPLPGSDSDFPSHFPFIRPMYSRSLSTLAFAADFPPAVPEFHQRTHRVRLRNLDTTDKKSSHKIKHRKIPRVHYQKTGTAAGQ